MKKEIMDSEEQKLKYSVVAWNVDWLPRGAV